MGYRRSAGLRSLALPTWSTPAQVARADALVFYHENLWNAERARAKEGFLQSGEVYLHYAVDGGSDAPALPSASAWPGRAAIQNFAMGRLNCILIPVTGTRLPEIS